MRRQKGYLHKQSGFWCVRYRGVNARGEPSNLFHKLASIADCPRKNEVLGKFHKFMDEINERRFAGRPVVADMSLIEFVEKVYLPYVDKAKTASTAHGYRGLWTRYVKDRVGGIRVGGFKTVDCRTLLKAVATDHALSRTTLQHLKGFLSGVFTYALNEGLTSTNPVHETLLPEGKPPRETHAYDLGQITALLNALTGAARATVAIAGFAGLRSGEMAGLRWEDIGKDELSVNRSVWRGHENVRRKTEASRTTVPVIPILADLLDEYRGGKITGLVFDLDLQKLGARVIAPVCTSLGLQWWGFHALRRGIATNLYSLGATDKIVQRVLRHAKATITRELYIKAVPDDVRAAMLEMNDTAANTLDALRSKRVN